MKNAKPVILLMVALAAVGLIRKAQAVPVQPETSSAATSPVVIQPAPQVSIDDLPYWNTTRECARLINSGLESIGKENKEPRKVHFEFTLTLPPEQ
jgi:hypothetical protein